MMNGPAMLENRRLRAPQEDRHTFHDPPLAKLDALWSANRHRISEYDFAIAGQPIGQLRTLAKRELIDSAKQYSANNLQIANAERDHARGDIILGGHQPELFHAGVWYKNFLLDRLAKRFDALAINLIVDNDVNSSVGIYMPGGSNENPRRRWIPLDRKQSAIPYEHRPIFDQDFFQSFPDRVEFHARQLGLATSTSHLWTKINRFIRPGHDVMLGEVISAGRAHLEHELDLHNLELPVSRLCGQQAFAQFFAEVVYRIDEFAAAYNQSRLEYQLVNKIKSDSHPVPPLEYKDDWQELPFWIWTNTDRTRRRLCAQTNDRQVKLATVDSKKNPLCLPIQSLAESFLDLTNRGIYIRPRALSMTMYVRLVLCELFVHGIGGAKYDQLTDAMIRRFFNIEPPAFVAATATMHLPIAVDSTDLNRQGELKQHLRDLRFHPEVFLNSNHRPQIEKWIADKRGLIDQLNGKSPTQTQHQQIAQLNDLLSHQLLNDVRQTENQIAETKSRQNVAEVTNWREYSYCLFPTSLATQLKKLATDALAEI
jgi:hypothetical protein